MHSGNSEWVCNVPVDGFVHQMGMLHVFIHKLLECFYDIDEMGQTTVEVLSDWFYQRN